MRNNIHLLGLEGLMKKYAEIYREFGHRTRALYLDADSFSTIQTGLTDTEHFVEHVVDFDEQRVIPCVQTAEGLLEVPDGDYGELTPVEYFIEKQRESEA